MLELKISTEALIDIFTPGALVPNKCVKGLPRDVTLVNISFDTATETVTYLFDDGKTDTHSVKLVYNAIMP